MITKIVAQVPIIEQGRCLEEVSQRQEREIKSRALGFSMSYGGVRIDLISSPRPMAMRMGIRGWRSNGRKACVVVAVDLTAWCGGTYLCTSPYSQEHPDTTTRALRNLLATMFITALMNYKSSVETGQARKRQNAALCKYAGML